MNRCPTRVRGNLRFGRRTPLGVLELHGYDGTAQ